MPRKLQNSYQLPQLVEAQATYYPHMASVFIPAQPILRKPETDPKRLGGDIVKLEDVVDDSLGETNLERSLRRTKRRLSDYVLCNHFSMFATFTFANDRSNNERTRQQMRDWLKNQRNRSGKFQYLIVAEFHKKGNALHFHALFNNYPGRIERAVNPKTGRYVQQNGKRIYKFSGYTLGFSNVKLLEDGIQDRTRVAAYIQKYMTKDMPIFHGKQRYWASKGLLLPKVEDNPQKWYEQIAPDWQVETPNGKILRFNRGSNPIVDIFIDENQ